MLKRNGLGTGFIFHNSDKHCFLIGHSGIEGFLTPDRNGGIFSDDIVNQLIFVGIADNNAKALAGDIFYRYH